MPGVYRELGDVLDQGDLLVDVPFLRREGAAEPSVVTELGIVTSNGCQCERFTEAQARGASQEIIQTYPLHVAPVYDAASYDKGLQGDIRKGRVRRHFWIPREGEMPDLIVDLFYDQPVPAIALSDLHRVASISTDLWYALLVHAWTFRSHINPDDVFIGGLA